MPKRGDTITTFRGKQYIFVQWDGYKIIAVPQGEEPSDPTNHRSFYAGVFGIPDPRLNDENDETS